MSKTMKLMLVFALVFGVSACSKNVKKDASADTVAVGQTTEIYVEEDLAVEESDSNYAPSATLEPVYFAFNEYSLNAQSRKILEDNASAIKERGAAKVVVEGNCDDRGTISYNIVLGDKRAQEVKNYYIKLGIPAANIKVVSYGEEKPVCTESTNACWSQNRRADTVIL
ncbi:MAG: OmpA family protein [Elusimicrobiaceae bacterium]|nr:OmpA family protein [Elusimicrobiaceae bacterium]